MTLGRLLGLTLLLWCGCDSAEFVYLDDGDGPSGDAVGHPPGTDGGPPGTDGGPPGTDGGPPGTDGGPPGTDGGPPGTDGGPPGTDGGPPGTDGGPPGTDGGPPGTDDGGACPCTDGLACCGGRCVDLQSDVLNCGTCGAICAPNPPNATAQCTSGSCTYECDYPGQVLDCDGEPGCEAWLGTPEHCAGCGDDCTLSALACCAKLGGTFECGSC